MSWGFPEGQAVFAADEAAYDKHFEVPGVTFVASTGDYGAADPEYPAFSPNVVAVGGTSLTLNANGSYNSETAWDSDANSPGTSIGSGGGISLYEPEPAYQTGRSVDRWPDDTRRIDGRRSGHGCLDCRHI